MAELTVYLLHRGAQCGRRDDWFIHVAGYFSDHTLYADGEPCERVGEGSHYGRWWRIGHRPERLEMVGGPTKKLVGYRLPAGVTLSDHPAELTPEEWRERFVDDGDVGSVGALYEAIREDREPEHTPIDVPPLVLEGTPPPNDGFTWQAKLPFELRNHPEYLHLFPGHIDGFREAAAERIKALPGVAHCFTHDPGPLKVSLRVNYSPPVYEPKRNARGRVTRGTQQVRTTRELHVNAPQRITGNNRAEAVAAWREHMAEIIAAVEEAANVVPCGHCQGRGWRAPEEG